MSSWCWCSDGDVDIVRCVPPPPDPTVSQTQGPSEGLRELRFDVDNAAMTGHVTHWSGTEQPRPLPADTGFPHELRFYLVSSQKQLRVISGSCQTCVCSGDFITDSSFFFFFFFLNCSNVFTTETVLTY